MRTETRTCDRCGAPATEWARVLRCELRDTERGDAYDVVQLDLCADCAHELGEWMHGKDDDGAIFAVAQ